jgi:hypothetical protein
LQQRRATTFDHVRRNARKLYGIIGNQPVVA